MNNATVPHVLPDHFKLICLFLKFCHSTFGFFSFSELVHYVVTVVKGHLAYDLRGHGLISFL